MELTREEMLELIERSKNDREIIVGSEVRMLGQMALADLAAKERSVQGWAIVSRDGKLWHVEPDENEAYTWTAACGDGGVSPDELRREGNTCQPVTITINAAGQEQIVAADQSTASEVPAPTAPVAESAEPAIDRATRRTATEITRLTTKYPGLGQDVFVAEFEYNRVFNALNARQHDRADGIRKGLERSIHPECRERGCMQDQFNAELEGHQETKMYNQITHDEWYAACNRISQLKTALEDIIKESTTIIDGHVYTPSGYGQVVKLARTALLDAQEEGV